MQPEIYRIRQLLIGLLSILLEGTPHQGTTLSTSRVKIQQRGEALELHNGVQHVSARTETRCTSASKASLSNHLEWLRSSISEPDKDNVLIIELAIVMNLLQLDPLSFCSPEPYRLQIVATDEPTGSITSSLWILTVCNE